MEPARPRRLVLVKDRFLIRLELRKSCTLTVMRWTWPEHFTAPMAVTGCGNRSVTPILHLTARAGIMR